MIEFSPFVLQKCPFDYIWFKRIRKASPQFFLGGGFPYSDHWNQLQNVNIISCSCQTPDSTGCKCASKTSPIQMRAHKIDQSRKKGKHKIKKEYVCIWKERCIYQNRHKFVSIWKENRKTTAFFLWATCASHGIVQILWKLSNFVIVMSIVVLTPNRWLLKPRMVSLSYSNKMPEEAPPACLILGEQANLQRISFSDVESLISHRVSAKVSSLLILRY